MDMIAGVLYGFKVALQPDNLLFCFIGCVLGTFLGVLPAIGPVTGIVLLIPLSYHMGPTAAIIMFAGIYYGVQYGGTITSILLNIPGEVATIVTCIDGYQMARQGRAGPALGISCMGSFIAGTLCICGTILFSVPLAKFALRFGPPEYSSLICMGFIMISYLASGSMLKAIISALLGMFISTIGMDSLTGVNRFTVGNINLTEGVGLVTLGIGIFGISEIILNIEEAVPIEIYKTRVKNLLPSRQDWRDSIGPILRGTGLGFFLGVLPGGGPLLSTFTSYAVEKKISKTPEKFGTGMIQGVAGPESANNAGAQSGFIPLLALGIPTNVITAILLGALMLHGITPGPFLIRDHPDVFWGLITSMYIGNLMLVVLNLPLVGLWVRTLKVPQHILYPVILIVTMIGVYAYRNSVFDIYLMIFFGILGYFLRKFKFEVAPLTLAFVLGDIFEEAMKQSLRMSNGNFSIFISRPISAFFISISLILILKSILPFFRKKGGGLQ